jgi:hypothetical protein
MASRAEIRHVALQQKKLGPDDVSGRGASINRGGGYSTSTVYHHPSTDQTFYAFGPSPAPLVLHSRGL